VDAQSSLLLRDTSQTGGRGDLAGFESARERPATSELEHLAMRMDKAVN
jgi:hypothetical protein